MMMLATGFVPFPGDGYESFSYPGGEHQVRLKTETIEYLRECKKICVSARVHSADELVQLCLLGNAIHSTFGVLPDLEIPYLPYGRADRQFVSGDCVGLAFSSKMLLSFFSTVVTLDAHNEQRTKELGVGIRSATPFISQAIMQFADGEGITVVYPDEGASLRYLDSRRYGDVYIDEAKRRIGAQFRNATKGRDPKSGLITTTSAPSVTGPVLIVDDICDGGATFIQLVKALREVGHPSRIGLYVTHGIFSKGLGPLFEAGIAVVYSTNSFSQKARPLVLVEHRPVTTVDEEDD